MINAASPGEEIWVMAGTYKPNRKANATGTITLNDRDNAFVLKEGVKIYGGFAGTESSLGDRNWRTNVTTLSGNIGDENSESDNTHHVVVIAGSSSSKITNATVLDGFTIRDGYGNANHTIMVSDQSVNSLYGGGIHNTGYASPVLRNLVITNNETTTYGGGIYTKNLNAVPEIVNCIISNNTAGSNGGGLATDSSSRPTLTNVLIFGNSAYTYGGGIYTSTSLDLYNVTIVKNRVTDGTGYSGFHNAMGTPDVYNCLIWGNTGGSGNSDTSTLIHYNNTIVEDMTTSVTGILDSTGSTNDTLFVNFASDDYHLKTGSAAINAGDDDNIPDITEDLDGNLRLNGTVDLGAYEYQ
jgi:predicted outer membrane repeat protein